MEPAINPDLTHGLIAPFDTTLAEMHGMGWFTDADLNGAPDPTVLRELSDRGLAPSARSAYAIAENGNVRSVDLSIVVQASASNRDSVVFTTDTRGCSETPDLKRCR